MRESPCDGSARTNAERGHIIDTAVLSLIVQYGLPLVILIVFGRELGLPTGVPVMVVLLLTGAYAVYSVPMLVASVIFVGVAEFLGTASLHLIMRTGGVCVLDRVLRRHREKAEETMSRWRVRLAKRDTALVFAGRLLPGLRTYITIGTGLLRIRLRSFISGALPAAMLWSGTPLVAGYLVRDDVQALQAKYASVSHVAFTLMPALGFITGFMLWVRSGHSASACLRRGRSAIGFVAALATTGYLISVFWRSDWTLEQGLPRSVLSGWGALLALFASVLLLFAYGDLRASFPQSERGRFSSRGRVIANEMIATTAWLTLLLAIGTIITRIGLEYPAL